ncbi:MAG: hypothetical protein RL090_1621 [Bacteroidota bacterium]
MRYLYRCFLLLLVLHYPIGVMAQSEEAEDVVDTVSSKAIVFYPSFGAGLVRNELSPTFHLNIGYKHKERYQVSLTGSSYFFFDRNASGDHNVYRNTFAGLEFMLNFSPFSLDHPNWNGLGLLYLAEARGGYFSEPAGLIYYRRKFRYFSIMPGIVVDDNLEDVWPMITIKL